MSHSEYETIHLEKPHPTGGYDEVDYRPRRTIVFNGQEETLQAKTTYRLAGLRHRVDGPAVFTEDGAEEWWLHGVRHREGGPAHTSNTGTTMWFSRGKPHRLDGPANEWGGEPRTWWNDDGTWRSGTEQWWIEGVELAPDVHRQVVPLLAEGAPLDWAIAYTNGETVIDV